MTYALFAWCQDLWVAAAIRDSLWLFPVIETFHLFALAVMGGMVLAVDLRLLGVGLTRHPVERLARDVHPWLLGALAVMLTSGFLLFTSEALKCYDNGAFWMKMLFLALAILFMFTIRHRVTRQPEPQIRPAVARTVAVVSVLLWTGVGVGGRAIGFY